MSAVCYKCQRYLPDYFTMSIGAPMPDDAWHMRNVCPDAAHGGIMMPICKKCDPDPLGLLTLSPAESKAEAENDTTNGEQK